MDNPYIPKVFRIARVSQETPDIKTISIRYQLDFLPGQFLEVSCFGIGEAPISISSKPHEEFLKISFKCIGSVTKGLFNLKRNDSLGIRGPFGKGFPLEQLEGKNLIFIAGGVGLAPLSSLLKFILSQKEHKFGDSTSLTTNPERSRRICDMALLYGSRTPEDMLYKKDLESWAKYLKVLLTVDTVNSGWKGRVGVVTQLLNEIKIDLLKTKAILCGPGIMMRFATARLVELGMKPADIILSLERHMKCGVGKCGHCYIADKFVCRDGPVFTYEELNSLIPQEIL